MGFGELVVASDETVTFLVSGDNIYTNYIRLAINIFFSDGAPLI